MFRSEALIRTAAFEELIASIIRVLQSLWADRGTAWPEQLIPTAVNLAFLDRDHYCFIHVVHSYPHEAEWTPFQNHYFSENLVAPEIEPGISGPVARNSDH
jgi:hypothetical protein